MPSVQLKTVPGVRFLSKEHRGPYAGIAAEFQPVYAWAKEHALRITGHFGIFYDDPRTVDEAQLRSDACIAFKGELPPDCGVTARELPVQEVVAVAYEGGPKGIRIAYEAIERFLKEKRIEPAEKVFGINHQTAPREHYPFDPARMPPSTIKAEVQVPITRLKKT